MREDIDDAVVSKNYRQVVKYMLEHFELDFSRNGTLSSSGELRDEKNAAAIQSHQLTWRAHEAFVLGGVKTHCTFQAL